MDEGNGPEIGRRERIGDDRIGAVRKNSGVADIDAGLLAELGAECDGMKRRAGRGLVDEIGLVEDVVAVGVMLVGAEIDRGIGGIDRAAQRAVGGIDVLVEFLVVGGDRPVPHRQPVFEIVLDDGHAGLHVGERDIEGRAAEEHRQVAIRRERGRRIEARR